MSYAMSHPGQPVFDGWNFAKTEGDVKAGKVFSGVFNDLNFIILNLFICAG
jgi:hypothetical protein